MSHVEGEKPQLTPSDETATCSPASNKTKQFLKTARRDFWHLEVRFRYQLKQFKQNIFFSLPDMAASNLCAETHLQRVIKNIMSHWYRGKGSYYVLIKCWLSFLNQRLLMLLKMFSTPWKLFFANTADVQIYMRAMFVWRAL